MHPDEYLKLAEVEDRMWYFRALHRRLFHLAGMLPRGGVRTVLDAGCGTGGLLLRCREAFPGADLHGLDFSPLACDLARRRTDAAVVEGSVTGLPFGDAAFDLVFSADVVCQVTDDAVAFRELARVLRPGGLLVVNVPALEWLRSYHDDTCQTVRRYRPARLQRLARDAGLRPVRSGFANFLPFPLIALRRKLFPAGPGSSDVKAYPSWVEGVFSLLAAVEGAGFRAGIPVPIGSSAYVAALKT